MAYSKISSLFLGDSLRLVFSLFSDFTVNFNVFSNGLAAASSCSHVWEYSASRVQALWGSGVLLTCRGMMITLCRALYTLQTCTLEREAPMGGSWVQIPPRPYYVHDKSFLFSFCLFFRFDVNIQSVGIICFITLRHFEPASRTIPIFMYN